MVPHTIRSDRAGRIIVSAGVFLFIALSSLARADQVLPPRPQTPIEAALGVHRTWHLTVPDSASRASRRVAAMARVRAQMADASGTPPRILFAEPPEIDSLPPVPPKYPPPPDSITSGLRSVVIDDLDGDGLGDVAALAPADSVLVIRRNLGGGHYGPPQTYPLASGAFKIALADFNGDGKLDVAVANQAYPPISGYSVLRNQGDGTYGARTDGALTFIPWDILVADVGHDGRPDLIFALLERTNFDVVRTRPDGTFDPPSNVAFASLAYYQDDVFLAAGDLDGDGFPDVVGLYLDGDCYDHRCVSLEVLFGRPDGTFDPPVDLQAYDTMLFSEPRMLGVQIRDLDGDHRPDIAVELGPRPFDGSVRKPSIIANAGQRVLEAPRVSDLDVTPWAMASGRFRAGAPPDLVVSDLASVSYLRNRGRGTFDPPARIAAGAFAGVSDFNGDGLRDVIVARSDTTDVLIADGSGGFGTPAHVTGGRFLAAGDFDGDHHADLALLDASGEIRVALGDGTGAFSAPHDFGPLGIPTGSGTFPYGTYGYRGAVLTAADLDGDGRCDLAIVMSSYPGADRDTLTVKWSAGDHFGDDGRYDCGAVFPYGPYQSDPLTPVDLINADVNGDGLPDLVLIRGEGENGSGGVVTSLLNQGHRSFSDVTPYLGAGEDPLILAASDFDGDGVQDIALAAATTDDTGRLLIYGGRLGGSLEALPGATGSWAYGVRHWALSVTAADFDGDGRPDVAVGCGYATYGDGAHILMVPNITPTVPTPTAASLISCDALPNCVTLLWDASNASTGTVERRSTSSDWSPVGQASADGTGRLRYDDRSVVAGTRYGYRLRYGSGTLTAETWVDVPKTLALSIDSPRPNPMRGALRLSFVLPRSARADVAVVDVTGRRVWQARLDSPSIGRQQLSLDSGSPLAPGLYFIRLTQGPESAETRVVMMR
jgi:hypothetical protein